MSVHRGGVWSRGCLVQGAGGVWSKGWGCLVLGGGVWSRGVPGPGGVWSQGGCLVLGKGGLVPGGWVSGGDPPRTATAAGGTHPTGMHSCLKLKCFNILLQISAPQERLYSTWIG